MKKHFILAALLAVLLLGCRKQILYPDTEIRFEFAGDWKLSEIKNSAGEWETVTLNNQEAHVLTIEKNNKVKLVTGQNSIAGSYKKLECEDNYSVIEYQFETDLKQQPNFIWKHFYITEHDGAKYTCMTVKTTVNLTGEIGEFSYKYKTVK